MQTVEPTADPKNPQRRRYYFDDRAIYDPQKNHATHLDTVPLDNSAYDLVIGQPWRNPQGEARGTVEKVSIPWTRGHDESKASKRTGSSPMVDGLRVLDWIAEQKSSAVTGPVNSTVARGPVPHCYCHR